DSLGYPSHPYRQSQMQEVRKLENRRHLINIGIAGACAGNVMLIAFALYGGRLSGMEEQYRSFFRWVSLGVTLVALIFPGRTFYVGALSSLRTRMMHMDVPVALALTLGTIWGAVNTIRGGGGTQGGGEVYFESLTAVIFLLTVGRWLQHKHQLAAHDAIELLYSITSQTARLISEDGSVRSVPVEGIAQGAKIELRAGDSVPADGTIISGTSDLDCSMLTGESRPVPVKEGDRVFAGSVNLSSRLVMQVETTGAQTRVGRLMTLVEQLAERRPHIVRLADRVAHYFVIAVIACAAITAVVWSFLDPSRAMENTIALLIVTCPCALGLATPLAIVAAVGKAAGKGIFIKGGEVIERLSHAGIMYIDKTGTITQGTTALVSFEGDEAIKPLLAAVEKQVSHPIARAVVEAFDFDDSDLPDAEVSQVLGGGVIAKVNDHELVAGSPAFVQSRGIELPAWAENAVLDAAGKTYSPVIVVLDGEVKAVTGFGDPIQPDARGAISRLRDMGWKVRILSGDHPEVVRVVAGELGIDPQDCEGEATPERKAEVVEAAVSRGQRVVMIGDGVNDAAALAAATVGVAVRGGAEASLTAADVFLTKEGLTPVVELLEGALRSVGVIKRNLAVSLVYNLVMASLAMTGVINPIIAAIAMPVSSLTVVTLSYRSRTF
ncbi:MAG TPA: cadmium-translocating P-type ATPase, partial [Phycisphaeraceae bacterium]|nr:cadmium-translocating P-type ATPase [Phycisphaeraceae bacterium]